MFDSKDHSVAAPASAAEADGLGDELATLAAHIDAGRARFLALLGDFDARGGWAVWGVRSCRHWLTWRCGMSAMAAREHVRVARALRGLPAISAAFSRGELSYSKVRAITRIATSVSETTLLEWARHGTTPQLERVVRGVRAARAATDPIAARKRRSVTWTTDEDGCVLIRARLEPEQAALVLAAIDAAMAELDAADEPQADPGEADADASTDTPRHPVSTETPDEPTVPGAPASLITERDPMDFEASTPTEQRRADALTAIARWMRTPSIRAREERDGPGSCECDDSGPLVVLHTDLKGITRPPTIAETIVHPETARRIACDAGVLRFNPTDSSVGRRTRRIPRRMRRALRARDRTCRFPSCTARRADAHHVWHWADGGPTALWNLILLCRTHHRLVHEYGYRVVMPRGEEPRFFRPDDIEVVPDPPQGHADALVALNTAREVAPDAWTAAGLWDGKHPDYGLAVAGFRHLESRGDP